MTETIEKGIKLPLEEVDAVAMTPMGLLHLLRDSPIIEGNDPC